MTEETVLEKIPNSIDDFKNSSGVFLSPVCPECFNEDDEYFKEGDSEIMPILIEGYVEVKCLKCGCDFKINLEATDIS